MTSFPLIILCAGFGKRMLNLTINKPKPLLEVNNKTLLNNTINFFENIGCNEFYINTHYEHQKILSYVQKKFNKHPINLIYEPSILGTGGAIKNIFNYTNNKNICVVNSDIYWENNNKFDLLDFLKDFNEVTHCKMLLSKKNKFHGLKRTRGDFNLKKNNVSNWVEGNDIIFYSGFQIVNKNIFENFNKKFSMNEIWNKQILEKKLKGTLIQSKILHVGDKNTFDNL